MAEAPGEFLFNPTDTSEAHVCDLHPKILRRCTQRTRADYPPPMWLPVSTVAALCVLLDVADATAADKDLDLIFKDRSKSEWQEAWHSERYTRCRQKLLRHLYWACEKDIYRITRRTDPDMLQALDYETFDYPWITERNARKMLRTRRGTGRRSGSSITAECCSSTGCTWEEYAEYCPTNKRYTKFV